MNLYQLLLLLSAYAGYVSQAANILILMPMPWESHFINYMPIFKGLATRGHNITLVSPFTLKTPVPNLHDIAFPNLKAELLGAVPERNLIKSDGLWFRLFGLQHLGIEWAKIVLNQDVMHKLIQDNSSKYDLIIVETWFVQEPLIAFGHKYNAPVVNLAARALFPQAAHLTGNHLPVSFVPLEKLPYSDRMSFLERVTNMFYYYAEVIITEFYYLKQQDAIMRKHFKYEGAESLPPLADLLRNTSLSLVDSTFTVGYHRPYFKNVVEFGGITTAKPDKLPTKLQKFMDEAKDGVILFSFGTHMTLSALDIEQQRTVISVFGKVKQKILMKLEATNPFLNSTPANVIVQQWLPQPAILAHPNCKLFITHGGMHSTREGIYYNVPMVAIPLVLDQKFNAKFMETIGVAKLINLEELNEATLIDGINSVLNNNSYKENIRKRSLIYKDLPIHPLDNAIYWVEYVIRHKGASHLRPAVLDLHWYQYLMFDVMMFLIVILLIIFYSVKTLLKLFIKSLCCKTNKQKKA